MAESKSTRKHQVDTAIKKANAMDRIAAKVLQGIDPTYADKRVLDNQDAAFQEIINRQLDTAKGVSGTLIVDFFAANRQASRRKGSKEERVVDTTELFTENIGDIFGYFQDVYKNRYIELSDLRFISRFIPLVGTSVRIYLDGIVSSDDVSQTITRNILMPGVIDAGDKKTAMEFVEKLEREYGLLKKLRITYEKTLVSGTFYVYHIPYKELFELYQQGLASGKITRREDPNIGHLGSSDPSSGGEAHFQRQPKMKAGENNPLNIAQEATIIYDADSEPALESFGAEAKYLARDGLISKCNYDAALESVMTDVETLVNEGFNRRVLSEEGIDETAKAKSKQAKAIVDGIRNDMPSIFFVDSDIPFDIINDCGSIAQESSFEDFFNKKMTDEEMVKRFNDGSGIVDDGTHGLHGTNSHQSFNGVTGTYLKWIDFKQMIPIEVLGQTVGYYHIITTPKTKGQKKSRNAGRSGNSGIGSILSTGTLSLFNQLDISERRKEEAIQGIVDTISNSILDQFSAKFVKKNAAFKNLIAECIIANGLVDNDYMIQFIPADKVIEFKTNEDENGKGKSILYDAMFPAHLLVSITVTKLLNYINNGGNRTIAHISSGNATRSTTNQRNRIIRDLQAAKVTFNDLLSSSMIFNKATRDLNMAIPKDKSGNRLVEFEVQEGQDIQLDTQYESMLEKWCAIALGMPSSIADYDQNIEVAKKVISDNIRVAARVASMQSDMEDPTTELYKVLIQDSSMDEGMKSRLTTMQFKLPRPRILANQNNTEALSTSTQNARTISDTVYGENPEDPVKILAKTKLSTAIVRNETPFIDWNNIDEMAKQAEIDARDELEKAKQNPDPNNPTTQSGGGGFDDMGGSDDLGGGGNLDDLANF